MIMNLLKSATALIAAGMVVFALQACGNKKEQQVQETAGTNKSSPKQDAANDESTSITYQLTGAINGSMNIKRDGKELKQVIDSEMMGMKSRNEIYVKGPTVYSITEINGKRMAMKTSLSEYNGRKLTGETIADSKEFQKLIEGKSVTGTETIVGKTCEIIDLGNNVSLSVADKKHILKIKSPEFLAVATEFQSLPGSSSSEFELPAGVDFKSVSPRAPNAKENLDSVVKDLKK